jgi:L-seryl-tRNA(Ser) seleniumtransferase
MADPARVKTVSKSDLFRKLPSVDELLRTSELAALLAQEGRSAVTDAARSVLDRLRQEIGSGSLQPSGVDGALAGLTAATERELRRSTAFSLRPVINATGVILHTNLGRAPLAQNALDHVREISRGYSSLEFDLESGARGERDVHVDRLFHKLLHGADPSPDSELSTIVVNNNAAAVWLALNTLAVGGEVVISRGELVEIGGSFRIPDVMAQSNGILREVGTTNRTRIRDYEQAINEKTRLLLRVHRSNFQITGFTEQPPLEELVALARVRSIPLVEDLGSGALLDLPALGIKNEPGVSDSLRTGVDVVTYSGDKLLGGPQAGMLTGRTDLIRRMRANSLFRALRVDKLTYAALEATLLAYLKGDHDTIPAVRMMRLSKDEIGKRANALAKGLAGPAKLDVAVIEGESVIGGGAAPSAVLPTRVVAIAGGNLSADQWLARLRASDPPVIARLEEGRVVLDLRTVFPEQDTAVLAVIRAIAGDPNQP